MTSSSNVLRLPLGTNQPLPDRQDRDWITASELMAEVGVTYRQVDYWTRTGLLDHLDARDPGHGHLRRYDKHQVARAVGIRDLLSVGLNSAQVRALIDDFLAVGYVDVGQVRITVHPSTTGESA